MLFAFEDFNYRHSGARTSANPESLRLIISGFRVRSRSLSSGRPEAGPVGSRPGMTKT